MAVSFSGDNGNIQVGYGIAVTFDAQNEKGIDWVFYEQPLDLSGEGDSLETFGNVGRFSRLAVTVPEANVTYDASINGNDISATRSNDNLTLTPSGTGQVVVNGNISATNIAGTLLKVQERKTAKGNSYAILKLTDLSSVFELFIFSDVLELNRDILKEGSSLILTLFKNISNDENRLTRINVKKIASLKDLFSSPINEVSLEVKSDEQIEKISKILKDEGKTIVNINLITGDNNLKFRLKNARKLDRKSLNLLRNQEIQAIIN